MTSRKFLRTAVFLTALPLLGCAANPDYRPAIEKISHSAPLSTFKSAAVLNFYLGDLRKGEAVMFADRLAMRLRGQEVRVLRLDVYPTGSAQAAALAKEKGFDTAIIGTIDELVYGGLTTASRATVTVKVIDANSGENLWTLSGTLSKPPTPPEDKWFYVDNGSQAPMPLVLAFAVADELALELIGKPTPKPVDPVFPEEMQTAPRDGGAWKSY